MATAPFIGSPHNNYRTLKNASGSKILIQPLLPYVPDIMLLPLKRGNLDKYPFAFSETKKGDAYKIVGLNEVRNIALVERYKYEISDTDFDYFKRTATRFGYNTAVQELRSRVGKLELHGDPFTPKIFVSYDQENVAKAAEDGKKLAESTKGGQRDKRKTRKQMKKKRKEEKKK